MADRRLHQLADADLGAALLDLAPVVAWPSAGGAPGVDLATAVRVRVEPMPAPGRDGAAGLGRLRWWRPTGRPARRALVLALAALLGLAAIAGAVGLGLPGLRLIFGEAPPTSAPGAVPATIGPGSGSPAASPGPLGRALGLGEALDPTDPRGVDDRAGFHVGVPDDPLLGALAAAWIDDRKGRQVTLLWAVSEELPATSASGIGLLLSQFEGTVDAGFFNKAISSGTVVEPVRIAGERGYWLSGDPHLFFWEGPDGFVDDTRRWVGDVLVWSDGPITYRLETSLGRDAAIRIAESVR